MIPETEAVLSIARDWQAVAVGNKAVGHDVIFRFTALWIAFNALYALRFHGERGDRNQVRAFAQWAPAQEAHGRALSASDAAYSDAIATLQAKGVYNFSRCEVEHIPDPTDLVRIIEVVYQVRCNLFHGHKVPADLRDRSLVQAAFTVISALISPLLDNTTWVDRAV